MHLQQELCWTFLLFANPANKCILYKSIGQMYSLEIQRAISKTRLPHCKSRRRQRHKFTANNWQFYPTLILIKSVGSFKEILWFQQQRWIFQNNVLSAVPRNFTTNNWQFYPKLILIKSSGRLREPCVLKSPWILTVNLIWFYNYWTPAALQIQFCWSSE